LRCKYSVPIRRFARNFIKELKWLQKKPDERIFEKKAFDLPNFAPKIAAYLQQFWNKA
jgi:hypothetical protein